MTLTARCATLVFGTNAIVAYVNSDTTTMNLAIATLFITLHLTRNLR